MFALFRTLVGESNVLGRLNCKGGKIFAISFHLHVNPIRFENAFYQTLFMCKSIKTKFDEPLRKNVLQGKIVTTMIIVSNTTKPLY